MKINKKFLAAVLIFVMIIIASMIQKKEILVLEKNIEKIEIEKDGKTKSIDDEKIIENMISKLEEDSKKLKKESVSDSPQDADDIFKIKFTAKNKDQEILFLYKKGKKYFIEQPYKAIYYTNNKVFDYFEKEFDMEKK